MAKRRTIDDVLAPMGDDTPAATEAAPVRPATKRGSGKQASPRKGAQRHPTAQQAPTPSDADKVEEAERDKRLNVPLTAGELRALQAARLDDGVPAAARVRAMIRLWQASEDVRQQVDSTAQRGR